MWGPSISDYYRNLEQNVRAQVLRMQLSQLQELKASPEDLLKKHALNHIVAHWDDVDKQIKDSIERVPAHARERFHQSQGDVDWEYKTLHVRVPIDNNPTIQTSAGLDTTRSSFSFSAKEYQWSNSSISFSLPIKGYGYNYADDKVKQEYESKVGHLRDLIEWKNADITSGNAQLLQQIKNMIDQKINSIQADSEKNEGLLNIL